MKTKPTQHSVMKLREIGIQPDILICRTDRQIPQEMKDKIAMFCNVDPGSVFISPDVQSIYELPLELHRQGLDERLAEMLNIWIRGAAARDVGGASSRRSTAPAQGRGDASRIVGKYVDLKESLQVAQRGADARRHRQRRARCTLKYVDSPGGRGAGRRRRCSATVDAVLVPGGFGVRGTEGKIAAVRYAREKKVPFFGICLGLQMAVIEYARNVLGAGGRQLARVRREDARTRSSR